MRYLSAFVVIALVLLGLSEGLGVLRAAFEGPVVATLPGQKGGMLALNVTLVVQALGYFVFIGLMDKVLYRPMLAHLDARKAAVDEAEEAAEKAARAARKAKRTREEKLAEAFREATKEKAGIKAQAVARYQELIHEARQAGDARVEETRATIEAEAAAAEEALEGEIDELAGLIRAKLIGEEASA